MASKLIPTDSGIARIANASEGGFYLSLTKFKVTETTNFEPGNSLLGTVVYEGSIVSIESLNAGLVKFTLEIPGGIPASNQVWKLGEIGLYTDDGTMFAHGTLDPVYEKRNELGLRIHAYIAQSKVGDVINASVGVVNSVPSYPYVKNLPNPELLTENTFVVLDGFANTDGSVSPIIATRYGPGGALWAFEGLTRIYAGTFSSILSPSEVIFTSTIGFINNEVVIAQITSGSGVGQTRKLRYSGSTWVEIDNKPFVSIDNTSRVAIWRSPTSVIESLQNKILEELTGGTRWASTLEYNLCASKLNQVLGEPNGVYPNNFGYGQQIIPTLAQNNLPTTDNWNTLYSALDSLASHQNTNLVNNVHDNFIYDKTTGVGLSSLSINYTSLTSNIELVRQRKDSVADSVLGVSTPVEGRKTRTNPWSMNVTHDLLLTFATSDVMRSYFNAGGKLVLNASLENAVDPHDTDWHLFLALLGNVTIKSSAVVSSGTNNELTDRNFYTLTTQFSELFRKTFTGGTGHPITYVVSGRLENNNTQLRLVVTLSEGTGHYAYASATNQGTLTSSLALYKPNSFTFNYPSVVSSGTL